MEIKNSNMQQLLRALKEKSEEMPISIAVCNDKGGSAKTTTAINLSEALGRIEFSETDDAEKSKTLKVLLIDGDDSRTCSAWNRNRAQQPVKGSFLVCNEKEAVSLIIKHKPDVIVYDTAGGIKTNEMAELAGMCHFFILPCKPDFFNSVGTFIMANWLVEKNKPFKILISDTPVHGNYARGNEIKDFLRGENKPFFEKFIKSSAKITDANNEGKTVFDLSGARALADAFSEVALETLILIATDNRGSAEETNFTGINENEINWALTAANAGK